MQTSEVGARDFVVRAQALSARLGAPTATLDPATQAALNANPSDTAALTTAVGEIAKTFNVTPAVATTRLTALAAVPKADLLFLNEHAAQVQTAAAAAPGQWKNWWWVCVGGMIFFLLTIPLMRGRWRPRDAKRDEQEHEAMVTAELAKLSA